VKTIDISPAVSVQALLAQAAQENLILKTDDGREFVLAEVDQFDREIELTRQNRELMQKLDERGKEVASVSLREAREKLAIGGGKS
jgi:hypothetical protein